MMELDLIKRIDASSLIKLHMFVDPTKVYCTIILERYPLLNVQELLCQQAGSMVYSHINLRWGYLQHLLSKDY